MKKIRFVSLIVTSLFFISCQTRTNNPAFERVEYINNINNRCFLPKGRLLDLDSYGKLSLSIIDSTMIITTNNKSDCWSIYNLKDDCKSLGNYISVGNGNNEVLSIPWVSQQLIYKDGDDIIAILYDDNKKNASMLNISKMIKENKVELEKIDSKINKKTKYKTRFLTNNSYFSTEISPSCTQIKRICINDNKEIINRNMQYLDSAKIDNGANINLLGSVVTSNLAGKIIVEAPLYLNYLNIYSLYDISLSKTICVGDKMVNVKSIQNKDYNDRVSYFEGIVAYKDYFGVTYANDTNYNISNGVTSVMSILFFDWSGEILYSIDIGDVFNSFDIDYCNQILYTLNYTKDEIRQYDIEKVLNYLNDI